MKYEVCIHDISQYLRMARNKVIILQLLLSLNLTLLPFTKRLPNSLSIYTAELLSTNIFVTSGTNLELTNTK